MSDSGYGGYGEWKGWSGGTFGVCDAATARYFAVEVAMAGVEPVAGRRVHEIGFGNGEFARWCIEAGVTYSGTERLDELVAAGVALGFDVHSEARRLQALCGVNSLDAVVAFDVFEHLDVGDWHEVLAQCLACLRPGGVVLGRIPSGDSPFSRAIQYGDITHKVVIGSSAVRQIAGRCGFEVLQVREPAFPLRGRGIVSVLRRAMVAAARAAVFPILRTVFLGNRQAVLTPNMVFVLRKPA